MRLLARVFRWVLGLTLLLGVGLASPVVYVEIMCRGDETPAPSNPLSGETRPEVRTLLTYPEWHIVHAYDDYAEVIRQGDPHQFRFLSAIGGYWSSLCSLMQESAALGEVDGPTRQLVYVIGASFTFEMLAKASYEETAGRLATLVRGSARAPLDDLSADQAMRYATFLQQVPWYRYDFLADAAELRAASDGSFRDTERAWALGFEHQARSAYAGVIANAVAATGQDDLTLQLVVAGLPDEVIAATGGVSILGHMDQGVEVETPRYRALTRILATWAEADAEFVDIAGNDQIMFTAISDDGEVAEALTSLPRQAYGDTRHLFLVPVAQLAATLRSLDDEGLRLEHIHDY